MVTIFNETSDHDSNDINITVQFLITYHINDNSHMSFDDAILKMRLVLDNASMLTLGCLQKISL